VTFFPCISSFLLEVHSMSGLRMIMISGSLVVTVLQNPHVLGGFGMTPNVIGQTSTRRTKVAMTFRFLVTRIRGPLPTCSIEKENMKSLLISTDALRRKCTRCKTLRFRIPPRVSPITSSQLTSQDLCAKSGATSTGGFSTQSQDTPAIGFSYVTNNKGY
jgi:hypothetical protein